MAQQFITTTYSPDDFKSFVRLALQEELPNVIQSLIPPPNSPKYLSRTETANRLKISKTTLTDKVKKGEIICHRFGERRILFKEEDVEKALQQIETKTKGGAK